MGEVRHGKLTNRDRKENNYEVFNSRRQIDNAQLGGNKQPCSPTLDHTLLSNSTLVGGRVERGWRDRIEIREEGIKAFISPEYRSLTQTSALFMTLITTVNMLQSSSNGLNVKMHIG
ncbi:hypothetical protein QQF64_007098 [Cirrhinus molitorella]|uniref:Uncharacterized protein n=1 Tax=Cirrhinus molitorella TaxID=172907 RepID=A0ABR3M9R5_9TELE